jgi:hypothetical protein
VLFAAYNLYAAVALPAYPRLLARNGLYYSGEWLRYGVYTVKRMGKRRGSLG